MGTFYSAPATSAQPTTIYGGAVSLNGTLLKYNTLDNYYSDSTHTINMQQLKWTATGAGTVAAFSYSYSPVYPKYSGSISLSDTFIKANGISISLSGISNVSTNVYVSLYQGSNMLTKYLTVPSGTVNFTSADLSGFVTNTPLTIHLFFINSTIVNVGLVKYGFTNTLNYNKLSYLK